MSNRERVKVGDKFKTNQGCECVIIEYNGAFDVVVQFQDEHKYIKTTRTGDLRKGEVANPFFRSVYGVGYYGTEQNTLSGYKSGTREYMFWKGIMERCYSLTNQIRNPTYINCVVDERWHNFQNFAGWCQHQIGFNEKGWQLDKDLLVDTVVGKVYSPDICVFVPPEINTLFLIPTTKTDDLPTGVSYCKDRGNYQAGCGAGGFRKALGRYKTPELAYRAYIDYKKTRVSEIVETYEQRIDVRLTEKLKQFVAQN